MKIGHFSHTGPGFLGAVFEDRVMDLTEAAGDGKQALVHGLTGLLRAGSFSADFFRSLYEKGKDRPGLWHSLEDLSFLPLYRPGKIICLGLNYVEHAREGGREAPEEPIYFEKAVTSMIANGEAIVYPEDLGRVDPEPELAVIVGRQATKVCEAAAPDHIAGYTIVNDVTARDMQGKDVQNRQPWFRSKSIDTFCPVGPWIVTADEIDPLEALRIRLRVNGEVRQEGTTGDLIFKVPSLIASISAFITLEAGDIISTGTPAGVAPIYPGDLLEVEVERIGILRNPVQRAPISRP
jgi:5-oxopent-3-ene-1,2,5-tricarboxylate decarboxylase / 2-hydroxyhepta-2,4-diene-1,7-dioate isomerase